MQLTVAKDIIAKDGAGGLYKGLSAGLLRQATYTTARLGIFQIFSEELKTRNAGRVRRNLIAVYKAPCLCCGVLDVHNFVRTCSMIFSSRATVYALYQIQHLLLLYAVYMLELACVFITLSPSTLWQSRTTTVNLFLLS